MTTSEWWDAGVVICLGQGVDLHMAQLMQWHFTEFHYDCLLV